jgi:hypothetical protein
MSQICAGVIATGTRATLLDTIRGHEARFRIQDDVETALASNGNMKILDSFARFDGQQHQEVCVCHVVGRERGRVSVQHGEATTLRDWVSWLDEGKACDSPPEHPAHRRSIRPAGSWRLVIRVRGRDRQQAEPRNTHGENPTLPPGRFPRLDALGA